MEKDKIECRKKLNQIINRHEDDDILHKDLMYEQK